MFDSRPRYVGLGDLQFKMEMALAKFLHESWPLCVLVLLDSKYANLQVPDVNIQGWTTWKCYYSAYILVQLMHSSLLECSPPTVEARARFPAEVFQSRDL